MKSFVRIFAAIWSVYYASAQTYSCGGATSDPVDVQGKQAEVQSSIDAIVTYMYLVVVFTVKA